MKRAPGFMAPKNAGPQQSAGAVVEGDVHADHVGGGGHRLGRRERLHAEGLGAFRA